MRGGSPVPMRRVRTEPESARRAGRRPVAIRPRQRRRSSILCCGSRPKWRTTSRRVTRRPGASSSKLPVRERRGEPDRPSGHAVDPDDRQNGGAVGGADEFVAARRPAEAREIVVRQRPQAPTISAHDDQLGARVWGAVAGDVGKVRPVGREREVAGRRRDRSPRSRRVRSRRAPRRRARCFE